MDICATSAELVASVHVLLGLGDGSFDPVVTYPIAAGSPNGIIIADLDLDGDLDIATENSVSDNVSVLLNDGTGVFSLYSTTYGIGGGGRSIAVGRIDGDWDMDLLVTNTGPDTISVRYKQTGELAPADSNGDGCVDIIDFLYLLAHWATCP